MLSIGEEIKQSKFRNAQHKTVLNILLTANTIYAINNRYFKQFGLSGEQYNVLRILRGNHPEACTVLSIQERMLDKMSNASRLVDKLETKGLLTRKQSKDDRRQVDVCITKKGLQLLDDISIPFEKMDQALKCVSEEELNRVSDILDVIRGTYRQLSDNQ
ncbi:MAG: MarR family transcriptional regulator [Bacteroidetes bacterium]|nr:MarR family transcriptional regulator [Bacteroidota bacterium]